VTRNNYCRLSVWGIATVIALGVLTTSVTVLAQSKNTQTTPTPKKSDKAKTPTPNVPDVRCGLTATEQLLVADLRSALSRLENKRLKGEAREAALMALQRQIRKEAEELRRLQKRIGQSHATFLKKLAEFRGKNGARSDSANRRQRVAQLARILRKMRPNQAATILAGTSDDTALATLDALGERTASKILAALPTERAVKLTKKLLERPVTKKDQKK
jgi:flagellar motility protein MotE (MotC chaperone)